jgi:hypothetical protein
LGEVSKRWDVVEVSGEVSDRVEAIFGYRGVMVVTSSLVKVVAEHEGNVIQN